MKTVLITGAGSGFGLVTSILLAKSGYNVIATVRNINRAHELQKHVKENNLVDKIQIWQMDITKDEEVLSVKKRFEETYGRLDILINNAGYAQGGFFENVSMEEWNKQFETNLFGHIFVTKTFLPIIKENVGGKIINISSISGFFGFPGLGPYVASKHALEGWSESLRLELKPYGISVSLVQPSSFKTAIWDKGLQNVTHNLSNDFQKNLMERAKKSSTSGGDPKEVAKIIVKICKHPKPKLRYPVGKGTRQLYFFKNFLPYSIIEKVIFRLLK